MGVVCCFYGGGGGGKAAESVGSVVVAADMHMRARTDAESFLVRRSSELSFGNSCVVHSSEEKNTKNISST